jgi:phosphoenolpyruvate carboxykinase (ATP)
MNVTEKKEKEIFRTGTRVFRQLAAAELVEHSLHNHEGVLTDTGALMCDTGTYTGRAPKDRYIVRDDTTRDTVWWGSVNLPYEPDAFENLRQKMLRFVADRPLYRRYAYAGAHPDYQLSLEVINTQAWHNLFCYNMFIRPSEQQLADFTPGFTILCVPEFEADPAVDGTRASNFTILDLSRNLILIGGTGYTGEMKKAIFSVLNYRLPLRHRTLSMHCSANVGQEGDTAIFFGLSGTGKTTLSADPERYLIGDDEHGWADEGVFNFEGGCYAKVVDLKRENEPEIFDAIRFGAILENTRFVPGTRTVDYADRSVTENTRVSYPLPHIPNAVEPSIGGVPRHIFFLTADAFGVLPPISRLTPGQAMYHFISGYTAKVAGTEVGVVEPQATFSACFGAAFMPLHPTQYAELLGEKIAKHQVQVWLVNTGWTGGAYGTGTRIKLRYTRALIAAALRGDLDEVPFRTHPVFGVAMPESCPEVPASLLDPRATWADPAAYDQKAQELAARFRQNFSTFEEYASADIRAGGPVV